MTTTMAPDQASIDLAFAGTNFGPEGETAEGRRRLVARCVLQRACGFYSGSTITAICKKLEVLTPTGKPRKWARKWAYCLIVPE